MRTALLLAVLIALGAVATWLLVGEPNAPTHAPAAVTPPTTTAPSQAQGWAEAPPPREAAGDATGSIAGTLVDEQRRPIAAARVMVVLDARPLPNETVTDARGRFTLFGVPLAAVAVRAEAPGFSTTQLGDLHPERAPEQHLNLGELVLLPDQLWQGTVLSRGRPLAGASVTLLPELLHRRDTATPLVQETTTDADGAFLFASGLRPPCLAMVSANGHRGASRSLGAAQTLRFDLEPLPRIHGRVTTAATGATLPTAQLWVWPMSGLQPGDRLQPRPDPHPAAAHTLHEGTFDIEAPRSPQFVLQAAAAGHVATMLGPFAGDRDTGPLVVELMPGCTLCGTVTWRGLTIAAQASLWPSLATTQPRAMNAVAADGMLSLPAVPPGRWLLRVDAAHGARHEQWVDLALATPTSCTIALPEGTQLIGAVRGQRPDAAVVVCTHESGLQRRGFVAGDGTFGVDGLSPGRWRADVEANPQDFRSQSSSLLTACLDDAWFVVGTGASQRHDVEVAALRLGQVRGHLAPAFATARIELVASDERQQQIPIGLRQAVVGNDGTFLIEPVLPGSWLVRLEPRVGNTSPLQRTILVTRGTATVCTFP